MSEPRLPPDRLPGWPAYLTRRLAAAYVGVSPSLFDWEVAQGKWPPAERRGPKGGLLTWKRADLDGRITSRAESQPSPWLERLRHVGKIAAR